jgi:hypothetical protein
MKVASPPSSQLFLKGIYLFFVPTHKWCLCVWYSKKEERERERRDSECLTYCPALCENAIKRVTLSPTFFFSVKKDSFIFLKVWDHFILLLSWLSTLGLHYFCSTKFYLPSTFEDIVSKGHFILPLLHICKNVKIIIPVKLLIFEQCPYEKILYFKLVGYYISVIGKSL